jgi:hypothetical protein
MSTISPWRWSSFASLASWLAAPAARGRVRGWPQAVVARERAWVTAAAAAWAAARAGVGDIAGVRARAATRAAAGTAAATVARAARARSSRGGARDALSAALAPTLEELQESALSLLDRMLPTVALAGPLAKHGDRRSGLSAMPAQRSAAPAAVNYAECERGPAPPS